MKPAHPLARFAAAHEAVPEAIRNRKVNPTTEFEFPIPETAPISVELVHELLQWFNVDLMEKLEHAYDTFGISDPRWYELEILDPPHVPDSFITELLRLSWRADSLGNAAAVHLKAAIFARTWEGDDVTPLLVDPGSSGLLS